MRSVHAILPAAAAMLAATVPAVAQDGAAAEAPQPGLAQGREITRLLLAGEGAALSARLSPAFLGVIGGTSGLDRFLANVRESAGAEQAVVEELVFHESGITSYYRRSRFERLPDVTILWAIDEAGTVVGGSVRPTQQPAPSDHLEYRTRAPLRLPFAAAPEGRWYVGWGGRDPIHNYHVIAPDQRFAYDLYVAVDGRPFRTDGTTAQDYYCFGQPILAPAAGTVVEAIDGLPDNRPGQTDRTNPVGNHVVIDHGGGEFSFLAHLQQGSVAVRTGDALQPGQPLGRCGNSGNTSMPHLHYHLQTSAAFAQGEGLPAQFNAYRANGQPVARGEPQRGETLEP